MASSRFSAAFAIIGLALAWAAPSHAGPAAEFFKMSLYADELELATATLLLPDGRAVITEKNGRVVVRHADGTLVEAATLKVDAEKEKGLLNVIAHPRFSETKDLIFYYSAADRPELDKHKVSLIRLGVPGNEDKLDLASERVLVHGLRGPDDHEQGGGLAIDRAGNLLIGVGDTGCRANKLPEPPYTPTNYFATCLTNGNGKILRVALDGSIPADNPLVDVAEVSACGQKCGEDPKKLPKAPPRKDIWAWGLRNPWRMWVDPKTGSLWTGDVGDLANEEIDIIPEKGGLHYGWPFREGGQGHPVSACKGTVPGGDCVEPAYFCRHDAVTGAPDGNCKSITGGVIIDDCRFPAAFRGKYFFADNANGRIWTVTPTPDRMGIVPESRIDFGKVGGLIVDLDAGDDASIYITVMKIPPEKSVVLRIEPKELESCGADAKVGGTHVIAPAGAGPAVHAAKKAPKPRLRRIVPVVLALGLLIALGAAVIESRKS